MVKFAVAITLACGTLVIPGVATADDAYRVSFNGYGPVKFGMTHVAAQRALGVKLVDEYPDADYPDCKFLSPKNGHAGVTFMLLHGHIARVDVSERAISTVSGARVGDSKESIMSLYAGRVLVTPHYYTAPDGSYLTMLSSDRKHGLRFETDMNRVTTYYAGTKEAIQFVEGCL
ncbi:hypothetical protein K7B09_12850 [Thermomonas sp. RSS23]|uniref:Uncharacterized protein n=1 Tax=Thermomonas beijingensis TaxID=2872701 RepID=A0ABS7THC4_9GAMM|nr:hypothetical protein [Thermomonas beijingensis]MBZ4187210.1 hypothetical protein [Thermomonas beijingensis]